MTGHETALCNFEILSEENGNARAILHREIPTILPKLRRYARTLTRDAADADDLVQECLARALAKLHLWKPGTDLRAWLFRLHNQHVSQLRRATRYGTAVNWSEDALALTCAPDQIEHVEFREFERAIMSLPEKQRTAVLLIALTPGNYYEVASACDVPVATIRTRLARGRRNLRELRGITHLPPHTSTSCEAPAKTPVAAKSLYLACDATTPA
jgi:RNA polymerase sigma-70 factor (ECF subfamily)